MKLVCLALDELERDMQRNFYEMGEALGYEVEID